LLGVGVAAWVEGYYLAPYGFGTVAVALVITVILGWAPNPRIHQMALMAGAGSAAPKVSPFPRLSENC